MSKTRVDQAVYDQIKKWKDDGRTVYEYCCLDLGCVRSFWSPSEKAHCPGHAWPCPGHKKREVDISDLERVTDDGRKAEEDKEKREWAEAVQRRPIADGDTPVTGVGHVIDVDFDALYRGHQLEHAEWELEHPDEDIEEQDDLPDSTLGVWADAEWVRGADALWDAPGASWVVKINEDTCQVVKSDVVELHNKTSPCYPGQGDLGSPGGILCFALPDVLKMGDE